MSAELQSDETGNLQSDGFPSHHILMDYFDNVPSAVNWKTDHHWRSVLLHTGHWSIIKFARRDKLLRLYSTGMRCPFNLYQRQLYCSTLCTYVAVVSVIIPLKPFIFHTWQPTKLNFTFKWCDWLSWTEEFVENIGKTEAALHEHLHAHKAVLYLSHSLYFIHEFHVQIINFA